jgi:hypothetical protein
MLTKRAAVIAIIILAILTPASAFAAFETVLEVAQPIETEQGIWVSRVSYARYLGGLSFGHLVPFTCQPNCVFTEYRDCRSRNAADVLGLKAGLVGIRHTREETLYGDTLKVFLDLSEVDLKKKVHGWSADTVIRATMECVLINAVQSREAYDRNSKSRVEARYLEVRVRGSKKYADLGGVYDIDKDLTDLPRRRLFQ